MTQKTPLFLMANLGSEVSKIISAKEKNNAVMLDLATQKTTSIISELKEKSGINHNKEIDILSDVINDLTQEKSKYQISAKNLKSYFLPFAIRLMQI